MPSWTYLIIGGAALLVSAAVYVRSARDDVDRLTSRLDDALDVWGDTSDERSYGTTQRPS